MASPRTWIGKASWARWSGRSPSAGLPGDGERRPPAKLYHGTFGWNSGAVSEGGIVSGFDPNWDVSDPQYVYLTENPELAANWVREAYEGGDADLDWDRATASVFEVDTAALGLVEPDPKGGSADWRHKGAIPASAVRLVYEADYTDDIPGASDGDAEEAAEWE